MPVYEYECTHCHHHFDLMQKMSDPPVEQCPQCANNSVIKLMSATSFQLKGTGWYATDFKNKETPAKKSEESSKPTSDKPAVKDTATNNSEAKPAPTTKAQPKSEGTASKAD